MTSKLVHQLESQRRAVDVEHFDITLRELLRMIEDGELVRAPEYQRKFRWDVTAESRFVESLFLGLPIPSVFVATNKDGTWEVVDGLQRLSTLAHFATTKPSLLAEVGKSESLVLSDLEKLTELNEQRLADLPTPVQLQFFKRALRVTALSDKSDPEVRFETFQRLNRGGVVLTEQEVRSCVYRGEFNDLLHSLASSEVFRSIVKLQESREGDGTREELVLKFFAYLDWSDRFAGQVTQFLNAYMQDAASSFDVAAGRKLFTDVSRKLSDILEGAYFLRSNYSVTPQNQLEAVMVALGKLTRAKKKVSTPKKGWLDDKELVKHSTKGTNTKKALSGRIQRAVELLS